MYDPSSPLRLSPATVSALRNIRGVLFFLALYVLVNAAIGGY